MSLLQQEQVGAGLVSIIGSHPEDLAKWNSYIVRSDHPLVQLHAKFWSKSMADEEQKWRNAQTPAPLRGGKERQDGDGDVLMGGGESEGEDLDDISSGCYILDIGIEGLEHKPLDPRRPYSGIQLL